MSGTQEGGYKAAATNKRLYGKKFYENIGRKGGKISRGGGFFQDKDLAREAGRKGGKASRKPKKRPVQYYESYQLPEDD